MKYIIIDLRTKKPLYGINNKTVQFSTEEAANEMADAFFLSNQSFVIVPVCPVYSDAEMSDFEAKISKLRESLTELTKFYHDATNIFLWLLGEKDDFHAPSTYDAKFYWRSDLRDKLKQAGIKLPELIS